MRHLSPEKKALLFIALLVLCSMIARALKARDAVSVHAGTLDLESFARQTDSAVQQGRRKPASKPKVSRRAQPPQPLYLRNATAEQLTRLPGITPTLADRIIAARDVNGRLTLDDIAAIPGMGRKRADAVRPWLRDVTVSRPLIGYQPRSDENRETGTGRAGKPTRPGKPPPGPVNVNSATREELESLPGIGPGLAERILAARQKRGRFATLAELDSIPGIGPALIKRLEPVVRF